MWLKYMERIFMVFHVHSCHVIVFENFGDISGGWKRSLSYSLVHDHSVELETFLAGTLSYGIFAYLSCP